MIIPKCHGRSGPVACCRVSQQGCVFGKKISKSTNSIVKAEIKEKKNTDALHLVATFAFLTLFQFGRFGYNTGWWCKHLNPSEC